MNFNKFSSQKTVNNRLRYSEESGSVHVTTPSNRVQSKLSKKPDIESNETNPIYCKTSEEKYRLLEAVDNNIANRPEICQAYDCPNIVGTCLDMCPEKDRYQREIGNAISIFERNEQNEFDHRRAVKEYERSAADQKESLSHDLRPTDVLKRTANYLWTEIVDVDLVNVSMEQWYSYLSSRTGSIRKDITQQNFWMQWYSYLWSRTRSIRKDIEQKNLWKQWYSFLWCRTRSIRKDITQQNLCNETVVSIIESITRFHIFCAAWFCEETEDVFSAKMNDDNLKNCLHTLKDMYSDMPSGSCPNEPEFRSYMVILDLNSDAMSYDVVRSPEMILAKDLILSIGSNNYIRFFRLFEKCDFILSCLLHRFIVPMRSRAFEVFNKAYVTRRDVNNKFNQIPFSTIFKQLKFESNDEILEFCSSINQEVEIAADDYMVILNYSNGNLEKKKLSTNKSFILVESKLMGQKLSTVFNGEEIVYDTDFEVPDCQMISFDEDDMYIGGKQIDETLNEYIYSNSLSETEVFSDEEQSDPNENTFSVCDNQTEFYPNDNTNNSVNLFSLKQSSRESLFQSKNNLFSKLSSRNFENDSPVTLDSQNEGLFVNTQNTVNLFSFIQSSTESSSLFKNKTSKDFGNDSSVILDSQNKSIENTRNPVNLFQFQNSSTESTSMFKTNLFSKSSLRNSSPDGIMTSNNQNEMDPALPTHPVQSQPVFDKSTLNVEVVCNSSDAIKVPYPSLTEMNIIKKSDDTISEKNIFNVFDLIPQTSDKLCRTTSKTESLYSLKLNEVQENLSKKPVNQIATDATTELMNSDRIFISELILDNLISEILEESKSDIEKYIIRKQSASHMQRLFLLKHYFNNWYHYSQREIKSREYLTKMQGVPRFADSFTVCQEFRGKVRKISTDWFESRDVNWRKNPILSRMEYVMDVSNKSVLTHQKTSAIQTNISFINKTYVKLNDFIGDFIKFRFLNTLDMQLEVLTYASKVDPTPDVIISDYNGIIDDLQLALKPESLSIDIARLLKLPVITLNPNILDNTNYLEKILLDLELPLLQVHSIINKEKEEYLKIDNYKPIISLSYFHLRLFPWINIIKEAVILKLKRFYDETFDIYIEKTNSNGLEFVSPLELESLTKNLSVQQCVEQCIKESKPVENSPQEIKIQKRKIAFSDIHDKVDCLLKKIKMFK